MGGDYQLSLALGLGERGCSAEETAQQQGSQGSGKFEQLLSH